MNGGGHALLLPEDADRSAAQLHRQIKKRIGLKIPVIITDTFGRPLQVTEVCVADELAGAAELVRGKSAGVPVAVVRGVERGWFREGSVRGEVVRPYGEDLFR